MEPALSKKFHLNNDTFMPAIGLGTFRIRDPNTIKNVVDHALNIGYRMFDTAAVYANEKHLKVAFEQLLPKYGLEREDIFVTTKLSPSDLLGSEVVENAYKKSLDNLGLDYVDLYLIHFPGASKIHVTDKRNTELRDKTWEKLAQMHDDGIVKAIGVSNFTVRHLEQVVNQDYGVRPSVNQVEWHPYYHQPELLKYCKDKEIIIQAYCSFGGTSADNATLLSDPVVVSIAKKLKVSCTQVLLAWALQQGVAIIPKTTNAEHMKQNTMLNFTISREDIEALNALGNNKIKYAWDPTNVA